MNLTVLTNFKGMDLLDVELPFFKNLEEVLYRIVNADSKSLQEVFEVFYKNNLIRQSFLEYKNHPYTVKVKDEQDIEQIYIKGIVDGMCTYQTFMNCFAKTLKFDKEEKGND